MRKLRTLREFLHNHLAHLKFIHSKLVTKFNSFNKYKNISFSEYEKICLSDKQAPTVLDIKISKITISLSSIKCSNSRTNYYNLQSYGGEFEKKFLENYHKYTNNGFNCSCHYRRTIYGTIIARLADDLDYSNFDKNDECKG